MQKVFLLLLLSLTLNLSAGVAQQPTAGNDQAPIHPRISKLPTEITLILEIAEAPGIANSKSFWEGDYQIRVADWNAVVEATRAGGDTRGLGEVLVESSFAPRAFSAKENARVRVSVPVAGALLKRLQQPANNSQAFLLRSTLRIYDAKLDQNLAFDLNRVWEAKLFPEGEASIAIKVKPDGSYSTWGPMPKSLPAGYTIIGAPAKSTTQKP